MEFPQRSGQHGLERSLKISTLIQRLLLRQGRIAQILWPVLLIAVFAIAVLVFKSGGIKFVYSHSMYLPILLSGFVYGVWGGLVCGVIGGLVLGPYMPIDTVTGELQATLNWMYRAAFFALAGILSGLVSDSVRARFAELNWTFWLCPQPVGTESSSTIYRQPHTPIIPAA